MDEKILIYTLVSFLTIIISIYAYTRLNILDKPNQRKIHKSPTPLSGGFAIVILITIFTIFYFFNFESYTTLILFFYLCSLSLFIIGLLDDLYHLNALKRIVLTSGIYLFFFSNDIFSESDKFLLIDNISFAQSSLIVNLNFIQSIIFTIFCLLSFQNSINMIDGLNGFSTLVLFIINSFLLLYAQNTLVYEINKILIVFLAVYFLFNIKGKLFFGESGIYLVSFITSILIIFLYKKGIITVEQIILLLIIPGVDMIRVTIQRILRKIKVSTPDKNHIHHLLLNRFGINQTLLIILILIFPLNIISYLFPIYALYLVAVNIMIYTFLVIYLVKNSYDSI